MAAQASGIGWGDPVRVLLRGQTGTDGGKPHVSGEVPAQGEPVRRRRGVRGGQILARGHNEAISAFDLTAHAETGPIRQLSVGQKIVNPSMRADSGPLAGSTLYTTCEPCPMCAWAICIAGISTVVIGARFADMGVGYGDYAIEKLLAMTGQPLKVVSRVLRDECEALRLRGQKSS